LKTQLDLCQGNQVALRIAAANNSAQKLISVEKSRFGSPANKGWIPECDRFEIRDATHFWKSGTLPISGYDPIGNSQDRANAFEGLAKTESVAIFR
jgi:hypothetical protein